MFKYVQFRTYMYYIYLCLLINGFLPFFMLGAQRAPKNLHCPALYTKCRKKQMMLIWPMLETVSNHLEKVIDIYDVHYNM